MELVGTVSVHTALPGNAVPVTGRLHQDPSSFGVSASRHGAAGSLKGACRALGTHSVREEEGLFWEKLGKPEHIELDCLVVHWHLRKA